MLGRHRISEFYNKRAVVYDAVMQFSGTAPTVKKLIMTLQLMVSDGADVLDLGCGTGLATEAVMARFPKASITGVDCSEEMLRRYLRRFPENQVIIGDFNDEKTFRLLSSGRPVRFRDCSFDLVISAGAVSEYGRLENIIPFVYRLLRDGGIFVNIGVKEHFINRVSGLIWNFKPVNERTVIETCSRAGFRSVESVTIPSILFPTNYLKYAIKATK